MHSSMRTADSVRYCCIAGLYMHVALCRHLHLYYLLVVDQQVVEIEQYLPVATARGGAKRQAAHVEPRSKCLRVVDPHKSSAHARADADSLRWHQYLYVCTSKASKARKLSTKSSAHARADADSLRWHQYLYVCTSKASKALHARAAPLARSKCQQICTFALAKQVNCLNHRQAAAARVTLLT